MSIEAKEKEFFSLGEMIAANKESKSLIIDSFTDEELEIAIHKKKDIYNSSIFDYRDVYGDLLYKIDVAYQPHQKVIYKDHLECGIDKIDSIIYNVDKVVYSKVVIIVNDETQANLLNKILPENYIATCPFFTFDRFREWKESYNEYLNKQKVFIVQDEYFDSDGIISKKIQDIVSLKNKDSSIVSFSKDTSLFNFLLNCKFEIIKDTILDKYHDFDLDTSYYIEIAEKLKKLGYKFSIDVIRKCIKVKFRDEEDKEISDKVVNEIFIDIQRVKELRQYKKSALEELITSGHPMLYEYYDPFYEYLEKVKFLFNPKLEHSYIKEYVGYLKTKNKIFFNEESKIKLKELYDIEVNANSLELEYLNPYPFFKQWFLQSIYCGLGIKGNITCFLLEGKTKGSGKSSFNEEFFPKKLDQIYRLPGIPELENKDGDISLANILYIDMDEINQKSNNINNWNKIKAYLSKNNINVRLPYARSNSLMVRRASAMGSMNGTDFLKEMEDRRFFIFSVDSAEHVKIREFSNTEINGFTKIDYMFSEAYYYFRKEQVLFKDGKIKDENLTHHVPGWMITLSRLNNETYKDSSLEEELVKKYLREDKESYLTFSDILNKIIDKEPDLSKLIKRNDLSAMIKFHFDDMKSKKLKDGSVIKGYQVNFKN